MTLVAGTRLGAYEIVSLIGAGGMGEVYRARDAKLRRDVAIKVLPRSVGSDAEALLRFEREAHAVAALSHPNILSIFDFGTHEGSPYAVMELLEGVTLRERLSEGALPRREAIECAVQIANGLAAAHEKGIVHRDLKPENIFLTADRRVKILDFGLAKKAFVMPAGDATPTEKVQTLPGTVVGTVGYMSPEQVRGGEIDARSDLFAFGAVLYEMLTGRRAFRRDSAAETLTAILKEEPPELAESGVIIPSGLARIVLRCLQKRPAERFQSARDLAFALEALADTDRSSPTVAAPPVRVRSWPLPAAIALLAALAAVAGTWLFLRSRPKPPVRMLQATVPNLDSTLSDMPLVSPDGTKLAYYSDGVLTIQRLDSSEITTINFSSGEEMASLLRSFFWSPDGSSIAFCAARKLWRVAATGGTPSPLCDVPESGSILGGDWGRDDVIIFSTWRGSLYRVPAGGGRPEMLLRADPAREIDFHSPRLLPEGRGVIFIPHPRAGEPNQVDVLSGGKRSTVVTGAPDGSWSHVAYAPKGFLVVDQGTGEGLWAAPFSLRTLRATAAPYLAVREGNYASVSADGSLVYVVGAVGAPGEMVRVTPAGQVTPIGEPVRDPRSPAVSPDGEHIAVALRENDKHSIWIYDLARGARSRLTNSAGDALSPAWTPAGDRVFFVEVTNMRGALKSVAAASGGDEQRYAEGENATRINVAPNGKWIAFATEEGGGRGGLRIAPLTPSYALAAPPHALAGVTTLIWRESIAPQGDFISYAADQGNRTQVFIHSFPDGTSRWQVSTAGGLASCWSRSGDRLYYLGFDDMMEAEIRRTPSLSIGTPRKLFSLNERHLQPLAEFDVDRDGNFIMVRGGGAPPRIVVAVNGAQLLETPAR